MFHLDELTKNPIKHLEPIKVSSYHLELDLTILVCLSCVRACALARSLSQNYDTFSVEFRNFSSSNLDKNMFSSCFGSLLFRVVKIVV